MCLTTTATRCQQDCLFDVCTVTGSTIARSIFRASATVIGLLCLCLLAVGLFAARFGVVADTALTYEVTRTAHPRTGIVLTLALCGVTDPFVTTK